MLLTVAEAEQVLDLARQVGAQDDSPVTMTEQGLLCVDLTSRRLTAVPEHADGSG